MPRRSEIGWIAVMVVVAVTLGFFIGGGPSLLKDVSDEELGTAVAATTADESTTTTLAEPITTTAAVQTTSTTTAKLAARPASEISVRVYNGSTKAGRAVPVGERVKAAGYQLLPPGPSPKDPRSTSVIHYIEGYAAEAAALAVAMKLPDTAAVPMPSPPPVTGAAPAQLVLIVADDLVSA